MNKSKFILAVLLGITTLFTSLFGQNIDSLNIDSIFVKSYIDNNHEKYSFHYSVVSYKNFVDVLILPTEQARMGESIEIEIFDNTISSTIRSVAVENSDVVRIPNLMKNREYSIRVFKTDSPRGRHLVNSNLNTISTTKGNEFRVSNKFYKAISRWSSLEMQSKKLISYLKENSDNVNLYEIAAFIQDHYKTGDISDNFAGNIAAFVNNPPLPIVTGGGNPDETTSKCNCSLVLNTHRDAPSVTESYSGSPEETNYLAIGDGAAKTMLLSMVGKHGSGKYEANIGGVVSPLYAIISYNLVCSDYYSDLPEECMCPKKILYDYSYTARLTTKAKKGGGAWIWSAGAEATAEDYAADGDFGHFVREFPDCAPIDPLQDDGTEVRAKSTSNELIVYPNPVTDIVQIEHRNLTEISVINLQGQVMHKQNVDSRAKSFSIDVSSLPTGHYLIMTKDAKGQYFSTKFQKI